MDNSTLSQVDYSRQEALDNTLNNNGYDKEALNIIIGCGGVGYWLGVMLAMLGHRNFVLIDGDKLDYSNLNRLPVPQTWIGVNKAVALRKMIRTMRPDTAIMALSTHISEDTFGMIKQFQKNLQPVVKERYYNSTKSTVWDTTDDAKVQVKLFNYIKNIEGVTYRKLGYEAMKVGTYTNYDVWTVDNYTPGYRTTNANVVTSILSACFGIFARSMTNDDVEIDLDAIIKGSAVINDKATSLKKQKKDLLGTVALAMEDVLCSEDYEDLEHALHERGIAL